VKIEFVEPIIPQPSDAGRSPGLHVSGLISHLLRANKIRQYKLAAQATGEDWKRTFMYWEAGFVHELVMTRAYVERRQAEAGAKCVCQLEVEKDGVFGTIDIFDLALWMVVEMKWTLMSSKRWLDVERLKRVREPALPKWMWAWEMQIKAYCYMVESTVAELHVTFGSGNYKGSGVVPKRIRLHFSPEELQRNWTMLMANAKAVRADKKKWVLA
jgi:hypothetical protein